MLEAPKGEKITTCYQAVFGDQRFCLVAMRSTSDSSACVSVPAQRTMSISSMSGRAISARILQFFLERIATDPDARLFVHFELIPDHLPDALKSLIAQFPAGSLQFEIGIQTFNPAVQQRISRRQDNEKSPTSCQTAPPRVSEGGEL